MSERTVYSRRLRSASVLQVCKCKVGPCSICGSNCRRCMCGCDGVDPSEALERSRGGYRRQVNAIIEAKRKVSASSGTITRSKAKNKRKKIQTHFKKVGRMRESPVAPRTVKQRSCDNNNSESDSEYVNDESTILDASTILDTIEDTIEGTIEGTIEEDTIDDGEEEFELEIETTECSLMNDDDISLTIAQKIMGNRPPEPIVTKTKNPSPKSKTLTSTTLKRVDTKTSKLEGLLTKLNIPAHWIRVIPSFRIREQSSDIESSSSKSSYTRLLSLASKMIQGCLDTLCPGPGNTDFKHKVLIQLGEKMSHEATTTNTEDTDSTNKSAHGNKNAYKRTPMEKLESVVSTLCSWSNTSRKRTIERRVIRAILYDSFMRHELKQMKDDYGFKIGHGQPLVQARTDGQLLRTGQKLKLKKITRQYKSDYTIHKCVDFILCDSNVSSVSWGSKTVLSQSMGEVTLPKLTRKSDIMNMYLEYKQVIEDDNDCLRSTSFYSICNVLTSNDEAMLSSIDYVSGLLVNETCETLQDIVDKLIPNEHQSKCTKYISAAKNFMKNQFKDQVMKQDDCCFHGLDYALSRNMVLRENTNDNACKFPFFVCNYLQSLIKTSHTNCNENENDGGMNDTTSTNSQTSMRIIEEAEDAMNVIDDISEKFRLFMAHQARCQCQSVAMSMIENGIKQACVESKGNVVKALIIMDFKMKYEMKSTRETTVEHFGKRGIGWHGFAIIFYLLDTDGLPYRNIVYIDQILNDDNKQDALTVVGLLEIAISTIILELPFIKEAILTSDNATCYQNHLVTLMIGVFNTKYHKQFFISSFHHSETQDGKSLLDAHFATSNRHLLTFMKTWRNNRVTRINTARGLSHALSFNLGLKNSIIQLIEIDRNKLDKLKTLFSKLITQCGVYYSRVNSIEFDKPDIVNWDLHNKDYLEQIKRLSFSYEVRAYSNINPAVKFNINVTEDKLIVDSEETENTSSSVFENDEVDDDIERFESSYNDDSSMMVVENRELVPNELTTTNTMSDFSSFRTSKTSFLEKLDVVGAFAALGISPDTMKDPEQVRNIDISVSDSDSDSDYDDDEEMGLDNDSEDDNLDDYFLSDDNSQRYGEPPMATFSNDLMITGTSVLRWLPLGAIRQKKKTTKHRKISHKSMIIGVTDRALVYAKNNMTKNNLFPHRNIIDPLTEEAVNFEVEPFQNGWAKRKGQGKSYGVSYINQYTEDLNKMFEAGIRNSSTKMSAGKMRDNLLKLYPGRFSIPGETQIKQYIGKLSQQQKSKANNKNSTKKSNRGREAGTAKKSWHSLLTEIIDVNPKEKPEVIYNCFIETFENNLPDDLPRTSDDKPDKIKIKSTIARFKNNMKKSKKRSIIV